MSGALRAKLLRIREQEQALRREVKTLRSRSSYARRKASVNENITAHRRKVVLSLCVFDKGDSSRAALYLKKSMRTRRGKAVELGVMREAVERLCLAADDEEFIFVDDGNSKAAWRARNEAVRFLADARVCEWVAELNARKGVAPSSADVHARFAFEVNGILRGRQEGELVATHFLSSAQRSWARRWRARWKVTRACIKQREALPLEEMQQKAQAPCFFLQRLFHFLRTSLQKKSPRGPQTRPQFWVPKTAPFLGPPDRITTGKGSNKRPQN